MAKIYYERLSGLCMLSVHRDKINTNKKKLWKKLLKNMEVTPEGYNYYSNKHCLNLKLINKFDHIMFFFSFEL